MVHFANPVFLLLLPLVPILVWSWLRQRPAALRYSCTQALTPLPTGRAVIARRGGAAFRAIALAILIVALAGPRWPDPGTRLPAEGIAIVMVVDVSGSMSEKDFDWQGEPLAGSMRSRKYFASSWPAATRQPDKLSRAVMTT